MENTSPIASTHPPSATPSRHASAWNVSSPAMSIPNTNVPLHPPPPLPPPRHVDVMPLNHPTDPSPPHSSSSVKPGSSLHGGSAVRHKSYTGPERSFDLAPDSNPRLTSSSTADTNLSPAPPPGRVPDLQALLDFNKLQGERQMGQTSVATSSHAYDKSLLSKIRGPHTPPRPGHSGQATAGGEEGAIAAGQQSHNPTPANGPSRPDQLRQRRHSAVDVSKPALAAGLVSPGPTQLRSPLSDHGTTEMQARKFGAFAAGQDEASSHEARPAASAAVPRESGDSGDALETTDYKPAPRVPAPEEDYKQIQGGLKRRAMSPPPIDPTLDPQLPIGNASGDAWAAQVPHTSHQQRAQQAARFHAREPSFSSTPASLPRNGSYSSSYGVSLGSTATSYNSDRQSPGAYQTSDAPRPQQGVMQQLGMHQNLVQPTQQPLHMQPQPVQMAHQNAGQRHQDGTNAATPSDGPAAYSQAGVSPAGPIPYRRITSGNGPRPPGLWICDCCPKKPKKFESEEDLRLHEMEKQYMCQYCHNRFKNKNEAERHQNSLHLRKHSWSCAQLTSFEMAFHPTPNTINTNSHVPSPYNPMYPPPSASDTCGYCGVEFPNPPDWVLRVDHLNHVHKFGECNLGKKFYRADHFRQHLKHSHAGTSGKWTNVLENACMKDEPPPQPLHQMAVAAQGMQGMGLQVPVQMTGGMGGLGPAPIHLGPGIPSHVQQQSGMPQQLHPAQAQQNVTHSQQQQQQQPPPPLPPSQQPQQQQLPHQQPQQAQQAQMHGQQTVQGQQARKGVSTKDE